MIDRRSQNSGIFSSRLPFKASRAALGLMLATLFLAGLMTFSTLENIHRARGRMERFLLQKGEIVIRSVEAALRTSLMHHMGAGDPFQTLIAESSLENDVVFIVITDRDGKVLIQTPNAPKTVYARAEMAHSAMSGIVVTAIDPETGIFAVSRRLNLRPRLMDVPAGGKNSQTLLIHEQRFSESIISIGLFTDEYDEARKQDVQHTVFMGAVLFLVGSVGFYLLFLYQNIRVARSTLANMKLYTDNVIESIPVGLVTLDTEDRVVSCNKKMEKILGRSLHQMRGSTFKSLFPACCPDPAGICDAVLDFSVECHVDDDRKIPVKIGGSSLVNNMGETIGTVLVIRDMSLIRDMEQQLERSRRMAALGTMAAGIAHEIRNPLGTLKGFAHFFGSRDDAGEQGKKYAELMKSEIDRLNRNVSGLLQFARQRQPDISSINLHRLIKKTAALMENDFSRQGVGFRYQCEKDLILDADPDLMLQVLMNLLKNSLGATPSGGDVFLGVTEDTEAIKIQVADTGIGMTEQEREKMFDPFFTTRNTGTGLGLAVSHQIVEMHNGAFEVQTAEGKGTTITIILPKTRGTTNG